MDRMAIANWATSGWPRLGLMLSGLWTALVVLMGLASSDPGQNYVALLLSVPILGLWCSAYAIGWLARGLRREHESVPPPSTGDASVGSLPTWPSPLWWVAAALIFIAAIVGAFTLRSEPDESDILHQVARIATSTFVIGVLAAVVYMVIRPRTSTARASFLLATAFAGAGFVLWQALDDTQRVDLSPARSASADTTPSRDTRVADRSEKSAKTRRQTAAPKTAEPSEPDAAAWAEPLSDALRRHEQNYADLTSKWDNDVAEFQFESMLTPATLTSPEDRKRNRERLEKFKGLLAGYLDRLEALQRDYRADVLAIDIPEPQRNAFLEEFEGAYRASVAETRKLNTEFERVELEIAKTILSITDLMEGEGEAVTVGSDGKTLLFQRDAAAQEYNQLLKSLEKTTAEEGVVIDKSRDALRKRTASLSSAADLQ